MRGFVKELLLIIVVGALSWALLHYSIYPFFSVPANAPFPARTVAIFLLIWILIRSKKETWKDFGLVKPTSIWMTVLLVIGYLFVDILLLQPFADFIKHSLNIPPSDPSFFSYVKGNLGAYIFWVAIAWGIGGFCEELIFRGYLMNRIAKLFQNSALGWTVAVLAQALLFGLGHIYLGWGAIVSVGIPALGSGLLYIVAGRNLWPVIVVHGIWDSLGFTLIYLNGVPSI